MCRNTSTSCLSVAQRCSCALSTEVRYVAPLLLHEPEGAPLWLIKCWYHCFAKTCLAARAVAIPKVTFLRDGMRRVLVAQCIAISLATATVSFRAHLGYMQAYAMTEASHQMTSNPLPKHGPHKPGEAFPHVCHTICSPPDLSISPIYPLCESPLLHYRPQADMDFLLSDVMTMC